MPHTISKTELIAWYDAHWEVMSHFVLGHYLTGINAHGIYMRNNHGQPITVNSKEEFLTLVGQKYLTQIIPEVPLIDHQNETKELLIDMDSPFSLEENKQYIIDCFNFALEYLPKDLKPKPYVVSTGGASFHLRVRLSKFMAWEDAKVLVEMNIIDPFYRKYGKSITFPPDVRMPSKEAKKTKIHLDMSSMKVRGTARCPYSFYKDTPQFAVFLPTIDHIKAFSMKKATYNPTENAPCEKWDN